MQLHPFYHSQAGYEIIQQAYDDSLSNWAVPYESVYVQTSIAQTHVLIAGDQTKPALMYFHGWNGNAAGNHAELDLPRLTQSYCVYMPDTPGHTGRSEQVRPDTTGIAYAEWIRDLCDHFNLSKVTVAGVSGGGYLACKAAAHLTERVERVLGVVPFGIPPTSRLPLSFYFMVIPNMMMGNWGMRRFVRRMVSPTRQHDFDFEGMTTFMQLMNKHFKPAWNPAPLMDAELGSITCPFDAIFAGHDIFMNTDVAAARAQQLIPKAQVRILGDEGHLFSPDGWRLVNDSLCAWVGCPR